MSSPSNRKPASRSTLQHFFGSKGNAKTGNDSEIVQSDLEGSSRNPPCVSISELVVPEGVVKVFGTAHDLAASAKAQILELHSAGWRGDPSRLRFVPPTAGESNWHMWLNIDANLFVDRKFGETPLSQEMKDWIRRPHGPLLDEERDVDEEIGARSFRRARSGKFGADGALVPI